MAKPHCCKEAQAAPLHEQASAALSEKISLFRRKRITKCEAFPRTFKK